MELHGRDRCESGRIESKQCVSSLDLAFAIANHPPASATATATATAAGAGAAAGAPPT